MSDPADTKTTPTVDLIRAHAMHESQFTPDSVHVRDKLFLLAEIDRLRALVKDAYEEGLTYYVSEWCGPRGDEWDLSSAREALQ